MVVDRAQRMRRVGGGRNGQQAGKASEARQAAERAEQPATAGEKRCPTRRLASPCLGSDCLLLSACQPASPCPPRCAAPRRRSNFGWEEPARNASWIRRGEKAQGQALLAASQNCQQLALRLAAPQPDSQQASKPASKPKHASSQPCMTLTAPNAAQCQRCSGKEHGSKVIPAVHLTLQIILPSL